MSSPRPRIKKSAQAFRSIGEAAEELNLPTHVLRFWETKFHQLRPCKRPDGRRMYRPDDIRLLRMIKMLLHDHGMTIKGLKKILKNQGIGAILDGQLVIAGKPLNMDPSLDMAAKPASSAYIDVQTDQMVVKLHRVHDLLSKLKDVKQRINAALTKEAA